MVKNLRLITLAAVSEITGVSSATIYRLMRAGQFPRPVKIGVQAVRWRHDEIEAHIAELSKARAS